MILLDTGYFIALFTPDDHLCHRAVAWSLHLNEPLLAVTCISFALMGQRNIQRALAYDHHFEQAGFEALLRQDPPASRPTPITRSRTSALQRAEEKCAN